MATANTFPPLPPIPVPPENPLTEAKRILGKILYWDEQLSSDNTMACGTCHIPSAGGTDPRHGLHPGADGTFGTDDDVIGSPGVVAMSSPTTPVDHPVFGFDVQVTGRTAPPYIGAMYTPDHFWDGRAKSEFRDPETGNVVIASGGALESQAVGPIMSDVEMAHQGRTWDDVRTKLQSVTPLALATTKVPSDMQAALSGNPDYPSLFAAAFGDGTITAARIGMAIASYERTLLPDQAPWDLYIAGDTSAMTPQQIAGWEWLSTTIPGGRCLECHVPPMFTDHQFYNIGLRPSLEDLGRQAVTGDPADRGSFKVPTLRNVGLRKHLGHVGWLTDVLDVIDFYNEGFPDMTSLHVQFKEDQSRLPISGLGYQHVQVFPANEDLQEDVAEFLDNGLTDPRVAAEAFPFDRPTLRSEFGPAAVGDQIKLMSYNVGDGAWDADQADRIAGIIDVEAPHVIGLQQVAAASLADLTTRLGSDYDVIATSGADNNNPILVRKNTLNVVASGSTAEDAMLRCGSKSYVNFVVLQQTDTNARLSVHNTQLCDLGTAAGDLQSGYTAEQTNQSHAVALVNLIDQNVNAYGGAAFAVGDFNAAVGSATMDFLIEQVALPGPQLNPLVLDDTYEASKAADNPGEHAIIYQPAQVVVHAAQIIDNPSTVLASAHSPVIGIVDVNAIVVDQDGDGVDDDVDNCPFRSNADQADNGGVDSQSADGIGDVCQCGDMNGDGRVTNTDSVLIRRHLLGLNSPFSAAHCDVNGDGNCSNTDSVIIRRVLLGLPPGVAQSCEAAVQLP